MGAHDGALNQASRVEFFVLRGLPFVAAKLKPIPQSLRDSAQAGSIDAKKAIKNIQTANQQIVGRAEKAMLKQTTLRFVNEKH